MAMKTSLISFAVRPSAAAVLVAILLAGCTTVKQEFHGHDPGHVWTAMQAVAQNPEYRDWHVVENHVHVDPAEARIHIYRILERSYVKPGSRPWDEEVDWRFHVVMEDVDPPTARFHTRGLVIPTRAQNEGRRFFAEVRRLLHAEGAVMQPRRDPVPLPQAQPDPVEEPEAETDPVEDLGDLLEP
jgi:hypothetical protein